MPGKRRSRGSYGPKKQTSWVNHTLTEQTVGGGSDQNTSNILDGLSETERGEVGVVLRVIWQGTMGLFSANAEAHGRWGLHVVTLDAFVAGAVPDPLGDHQSSWYWNEAFAIDEPDLRQRVFHGETRTRRKLPSGEHTVVMVWETAAGSAGSLKYDIGLRILYSHR